MDLNAIKAKAGISDNSSTEKTPLSTDSLHRSGDSAGKRRFWYPEQDDSTTSPPGPPPEANSDKNGEQRGSKGVAKGQLNGEQRGSKGAAKGQLENETLLLNGEQRGSKGVAKGQLNGEQTAPSSSSYKNTNLLTTTTADVETRACAEDEWSPQDLDYSMLTDIGFGKSQVLQLRSLGIPFDIVQRSLVHFDFELRHTQSGKTIHEPLALLMKRMRQNGCWPAPEEFEKRHAYFRNLFDERDRQIQENPTVSEANSDTLEAWE